MLPRFIALLLGLTLFSVVISNPVKRTLSHPIKKHLPPAPPAINTRQTTRERINQRALVKRAKEKFQAIKRSQSKSALLARGNAKRQDPVPSATVYPECANDVARGSGFAHYPGWDYYSNDIPPGNPRFANPNTEANCIELCQAHIPSTDPSLPWQDTNCIGVTYYNNGECYLKGELYQFGRFEPRDQTFSADLIGGCAAWRDIVPAAMDAVCCNL